MIASDEFVMITFRGYDRLLRFSGALRLIVSEICGFRRCDTNVWLAVGCVRIC